jgi:hypothetical protein
MKPVTYICDLHYKHHDSGSEKNTQKKYDISRIQSTSYLISNINFKKNLIKINFLVKKKYFQSNKHEFNNISWSYQYFNNFIFSSVNNNRDFW